MTTPAHDRTARHRPATRQARIELAIIAAVAVAAGIAEYSNDGLRRATVSLVEREDLLAAELLALLLITAIGMAIYAWRRYREFLRAENLNLSLRASVSEAGALNQRYRSYADAIVRGQEHERLRLARELHDDTIHRLILIGQKLELARMDLEPSPTAPDLEEVQQLTNNTIDHIRRFIQDLRPTFLDELGLVPALQALTDEKTDRTGIKMTLTTTGQPPPPRRERRAHPLPHRPNRATKRRPPLTSNQSRSPARFRPRHHRPHHYR